MIDYTDCSEPIDTMTMWWDRFGAAWVVISTLMDPSAFWLRGEDLN